MMTHVGSFVVLLGPIERYCEDSKKYDTNTTVDTELVLDRTVNVCLLSPNVTDFLHLTDISLINMYIFFIARLHNLNKNISSCKYVI